MNPEGPRNEIARLVYATRNSLKGYARVFRDEPAFRFQVAILIVVVPVALTLARTWLEFSVLVASWVLVLAAELGNSAIEAAIADRKIDATEAGIRVGGTEIRL
ncbi:MAG: diacylglycerol kinase, partial [Wenzhouxiangellaceae bacterium]